MDAASRQLVETLFHEAAELPPESRAAFLDGACGEPWIRAEVDSLLAHLDSRTLATLQSVEDMDETEDDLLGQRIGQYELVELIGEGGFGAVYLARQEQPVKRTVALKIVKLGMDTRQVIARFEAERQALAMMEHPNIAKVFDAGATETGRPYFVMEHVRGAPITEYCDENRSSISQRLELMVKVCRAVHHAHQKGVIHRDIKPGNVLVAVRDGAPTPMVIDFGVAKAMYESLTDRTRLTSCRQFIGTPEYVSPEQADMSGTDVDTRGDVYSLGVLLHELLTGVTPSDALSLRSASHSELLRLVREQAPLTPSRRIVAAGFDSRAAADARSTDAGALRKALRGDLDWIVMKSLEKERDRRYDSAVALADDIQRHLRNEPVTAGPPGYAYQLRKLAARHKVAFASAVALLVTLTAFGGWMSLLYAEADALRARAERERAAAEINMSRAQSAEKRAATEAKTTSQIVQVMMVLLEAADPLKTAGRDGPREMLDAGAQSIRDNLNDQPDIQAALLDIVGRVYTNLGLYDDAERLLTRALALRRTSLGTAHPDTIASMNSLGHSLMYDRKLSRAEPLLREAAALGRDALGADHPHTVQAAANLAWTLQALGRYDEAEPLCRHSLESHRRLYGDEHPQTLVAINALSWLLQHMSALDEARALSEEALETSERVFGRESVPAAESMNILGVLNIQENRLSEGESLLREASAVRRRLLGRDHPETLESTKSLAWALLRQGAWADAETSYRAALAGYERAYEPSCRDAHECMCHVAMALAKQGKHDEAELYLDKASPVLQDELRNLGVEPPNCALLWLDVREEQGRLGEHEALIREFLARHQEAFGPAAPRTIGFSFYLVHALLQQNRPREAESLARGALDLTRDKPRSASAGPCVGCLSNLLGECLIAEERYEEAEATLLAGVAAVADHHGETHATTLRAIQRVAAFYETWNKPLQAAEWRGTLPD